MKTPKAEEKIKHIIVPADAVTPVDMHINWSDEDNCYVVSVPQLQGCMTDGDTIKRAILNGREAVACHLEARSSNLPKSGKRYSGVFQFRPGPEIHRKLAMDAAIQGVSLNELLLARALGSSRTESTWRAGIKARRARVHVQTKARRAKVRKKKSA